ncbi:MAG: hypothetical protein HYX34_15335 [Actinobacteria bacterium]|nr:hypothetical protein [Actinomycetota bacterium]
MTGLRTDTHAMETVTAILAPSRPPRAEEPGEQAGPVHRYAVLPSARRPRYIVPVQRAAAASTRFRTARRAHHMRAMAVASLRAGSSRMWPVRVAVPDGSPSDPSLRRWLATALGEPDLEIAVALGGPRPNRKPVLQLIDPAGTTIGFAKVAVDDHTAELVANESAVLGGARPAPPLVLPGLRFSGSWRGRPVLVLDDIHPPAPARRLRLDAKTVRALAELAPVTMEPVALSSWWTSLEHRAARAADPGLAALVADLHPRLAGRTWEFGRWHGDLAPWNATWNGDHLLVWDWERSEAPVPLGFDLLHNLSQVHLLVLGGDASDLARRLCTEAGPVLRDLGIAAEDHLALVLAYLVELRVRWALDARAGRVDQKHGRIAVELGAALAQAVSP